MLPNVRKDWIVSAGRDLEEPAFAREFIALMEDYGWEMLREQLKKLKAGKEVFDLLDDLLIISNCPPPERTTWLENQMMYEAMGSLSHTLVKLGVRIGTPRGQVITP